MSSFHESTDAPLERWAFPLLLAIVSLAFVRILPPLYGTILWGSIIALVFAP